jgi:hypothetical protein
MPINASTCMYVWNLAMEKCTLVETGGCKFITICMMKYSVRSCHHCNVYSPTTFSTEQQMDSYSKSTTTSCCTLRHIMFKHHKGQSDRGNLVTWVWPEYMVNNRTGNMIFCMWVYGSIGIMRLSECTVVMHYSLLWASVQQYWHYEVVCVLSRTVIMRFYVWVYNNNNAFCSSVCVYSSTGIMNVVLSRTGIMRLCVWVYSSNTLWASVNECTAGQALFKLKSSHSTIIESKIKKSQTHQHIFSIPE